MSSAMRWWVATFDGWKMAGFELCDESDVGESTREKLWIKARTSAEGQKRARYVRKRMVHDARCAENRAKGLCGCGKPLDRGINPNTGTPYVKCTKCQGVITPYVTNPSAKAPPVDERKDEQPRPGDSVRVIQHKLLKQIQFEWETSPNNQLFTRYLKRLIQQTTEES